MSSVAKQDQRRRIAVELYPDDLELLQQILAERRAKTACREEWRGAMRDARRQLLVMAIVGAVTSSAAAVAWFGREALIAFVAWVQKVLMSQ